MIDPDDEHLRLLTIFHYVMGGLTAFFSCLFLIHIGMGIAMLCNPHFLEPQHGQPPPPAFVGWIFLTVGSVFFLMGEALAVCMFMAGSYIRRRKHYMFAFVVACVECLIVPFGTILGVFSLITLSRESVKARFNGPPPIGSGAA